MRELEGQLDVEQEKLASLVRSLSMDVSQQHQQEETVSEEWLQSLKERRKVRPDWGRDVDMGHLARGQALLCFQI